MNISLKQFSSNMLNFPTYYNFNLFWNFGFMMLLLFIIQLFTGMFISFYMNFNFKSTLLSKFYILNVFKHGWFFIKLHCILPSLMFLFMYLHIFKSLFNFIYSPFKVFFSGFMLYILFVLISFTGYSMAGGAMGYWAMVVVCNMVKFMLGSDLSSSMFFSDKLGVNTVTINKLFLIHYMSSFMCFLVMYIHVFLLHKCGSSNGVNQSYMEIFSFNSVMLFKDFMLLLVLCVFFMFFMFVKPSTVLMSGDNFLEMDEFKSLDIKVEWYLSFFFMMLSGVESKFFGMIFTFLFMFMVMFDLFDKDFFSLSQCGSIYIVLSFYCVWVILSFSWFHFSSYLISVPILMLLILMLNMFLLMKQNIKFIKC